MGSGTLKRVSALTVVAAAIMLGAVAFAWEGPRARPPRRAKEGKSSVYRKERRVTGEVTPPRERRPVRRQAPKRFDPEVEPAAYEGEAEDGVDRSDKLNADAEREEADNDAAGDASGDGEAANAANIPAGNANGAVHPLEPCLEWARTSLDQFNEIPSYSCTLVKRERINGKMLEHEYMYLKVRREPFSVYTLFMKPSSKKNDQAIFVEGQNSGKLLGKAGDIRRLAGWVALDPEGDMAMKDNRYPITQVGIQNLLERLIEVGENDAQYGECEVKTTKNIKVNKRDCTRIEVIHPTRRANFIFHKARIFVDKEYNLPIRYEAYDWPAQKGGEPVLTEEYTYVDLNFGVTFGDEDFDKENPEYNGRR